MGEIDDFDLDRSVATAWNDFTVQLAEVISMVDDSADLTIRPVSAGQTGPPYVRISSPRRLMVRADAAGNAELGPTYQLGTSQLAAMAVAGWSPLSAVEGSTFTLELPQDAAEELAGRVVEALRDVYGVQHPAFLEPDQLGEILHTAPPVIEGAAKADPVITGPQQLVLSADSLATAVLPTGRGHLNALVDAVLTNMLGHPPSRDDEGDVVIRVGSTLVFLRTAADGQDVLLFSAVVHDISGRSRAAEVINDLNVESRWVKFQLIRDRVFATTSVPARPFVPVHLYQAVQILSEVADGVDDELAVKLNGRTTFSSDG